MTNDMDRLRKYAKLPSDGIEFEKYLYMLFQDLGYEVKRTPASGDYGADLIAKSKNGRCHSIQAKFFNSGRIGVSPVQEVMASLRHWNADDGWVVTNGDFTRQARILAHENSIKLIDGDELNRLINKAIDGVWVGENLETADGIPLMPKPIATFDSTEQLIQRAKEADRDIENAYRQISTAALDYYLHDKGYNSDVQEIVREAKEVYERHKRLLHPAVYARVSLFPGWDCSISDEDASKWKVSIPEGEADAKRIWELANQIESKTQYHEEWKRVTAAKDEEAIRRIYIKRLGEFDIINFEIRLFVKYCMRLCGKHILYKYPMGTLEYAAYIGKDEDLWKYNRWPDSRFGETRNDGKFNVQKAMEEIRVIENNREWFASATSAMSMLDAISNEPIEAHDAKQMYKDWHDLFIPLYTETSFAHANPDEIVYPKDRIKNEDLKSSVEHRWGKTHDNITELRKLITGLCDIPNRIKEKREENLANAYNEQIQPIKSFIESNIVDYNQASGFKKIIIARTIRHRYRKLLKINEEWSKSTFLVLYNPNLPDELV